MPSTRPQSSRLQVIKSVTGLLPLRQKSRENLPPVDRIKILVSSPSKQQCLFFYL